MAVGPQARAKLYEDRPPATEVTTTHIDGFLEDTDIRKEGPAQPHPKSVSRGSDLPKLTTWVTALVAWLGGLF